MRVITHVGAGASVRLPLTRVPARLDFLQSASGLLLALFMWGHMFFVSSILLGNDAMWTITKLFEGYFFFGRPYPGIVSFIVACVIVLFVGHAFLALRKFPINYEQYRTYRDHMKGLRHEDTTLWFWQVVTGFALFFLATIHLYVMLTRPSLIGPYESADRVWSDLYWPLYLVLLFVVELHGGIGLYRLCVKWGWFAVAEPNATRKRLKKLKWALTIFFTVLGLATIHLYVMLTRPSLIGPYESADRVWSDLYWPLYLVLLFVVELHGGIGLYRLCVKWGWFAVAEPNATRKRLKKLKWALTIFFTVLGLATLAAYMKIGIEHAPHYGERYTPAWAQPATP